VLASPDESPRSLKLASTPSNLTSHAFHSLRLAVAVGGALGPDSFVWRLRSDPARRLGPKEQVPSREHAFRRNARPLPSSDRSRVPSNLTSPARSARSFGPLVPKEQVFSEGPIARDSSEGVGGWWLGPEHAL
jgi:hypothetical protein